MNLHIVPVYSERKWRKEHIISQHSQVTGGYLVPRAPEYEESLELNITLFLHLNKHG